MLPTHPFPPSSDFKAHQIAVLTTGHLLQSPEQNWGNTSSYALSFYFAPSERAPKRLVTAADSFAFQRRPRGRSSWLSWRVTPSPRSFLGHHHWVWGAAQPPGPSAIKYLCTQLDDFQFWKTIKEAEFFKNILQQARHPVAPKLSGWLTAGFLNLEKSNEVKEEIFGCLYCTVVQKELYQATEVYLLYILYYFNR